jgi:hypothetical protein
MRRLINSYHPIRLKPRVGERMKDLHQTQLYYYERLSYIIRYLYVSGGKRDKVKYQQIMDKIMVKYALMAKKSEKTKNKIKEWIIKEN